jgi:diguanylate cyclase (GGDEF)-like protein
MFGFNRDKALRQAEKYVQQGKLTSAIDEYEAILEEDPADLSVVNTLGDLCARAGRNADAVKYYHRVAQDFVDTGATVKAVAMFKKILKLDPSSHETAMRLGDYYAGQKLLGEARQHYQLAADACRKAGLARTALGVLKKIAELEPDNYAARLEYARVASAEGFPNDAHEGYRAAGAELLRAGRTADAVAAFKCALEIRPGAMATARALADAYLQLGDVDEALALLRRLLDEKPGDIELLLALGRTYRAAGDLEKAESVFSKLLEVDNSRYDALLDVARAFVDRGDSARALAILDRCQELLLARRQKKKATALLKAILEREPDNVVALRRLAGIYKRVREKRNLVATLNLLVEITLRLGQKAEAAELLRQLVEIQPNKPNYKERLDTLAVGPPPAQEFPEGFESVPALAEWTRVTAGLPPAATPAVEGPAEGEAIDSGGEYSTQLLEEMVARNPEFNAARIGLLEELLAGQPNYLDGRLKLKQIYLDCGMVDKAAAQCLELARLHGDAGDEVKAREALWEAYQLNPTLERGAAEATIVAPQTANGPGVDAVFDEAVVDKYLSREWRREGASHRPLTVIAVSVDSLETYAAARGAAALARVMDRLALGLESALVRPGELLGYCGGGSFLAVLPDADAPSAHLTAERMRSNVESMAIEHGEAGAGAWITVSLGVEHLASRCSGDPKAAIIAARQKCARASQVGGNRIIS